MTPTDCHGLPPGIYRALPDGSLHPVTSIVIEHNGLSDAALGSLLGSGLALLLLLFLMYKDTIRKTKP